MVRHGRRWWAVRIREYEQDRESWGSMLAFCRAKGVNYWTFREWRLRLNPGAVKSEPGIVRVEVGGGPGVEVARCVEVAPTPVVEAELMGTVTLRFRAGTDVAYVAELLGAMKRRLGC